MSTRQTPNRSRPPPTTGPDRRQAADDADDDDATSADGAAASDTQPYGPGSHTPLDGGEQPPGYDIKGNANSMLYHEPSSPGYERTIAEVWFDSVASAEAAGFAKPKTGAKKAGGGSA